MTSLTITEDHNALKMLRFQRIPIPKLIQFKLLHTQITVLDDMHGMFTGHPDEKSQNAEEVNPASPVGGMLIQQRKDDPDHAVDTKFNVHVIDTKNSPVLKDKPGGGRRLLTTPE